MRAPTAALIVLLAAAAHAEPPLDVDAAVAKALARHPLLKAADQAVAGAEHRADEARTAWLPRADVRALAKYTVPVPELTVNTGITPPGQTEPLKFTNKLGSADYETALVEVGWRAWDFSRGSQIDAAEAQADAARDVRQERAVDLAFAVRQAYLGTVFFRELAAVTERSLDVARALLADAQNQAQAGVGRPVDVSAAEARVAELDARGVDARQNGAQAEATLRLLLGLSADAPLTLTDALGAEKGEAQAAAPTKPDTAGPSGTTAADAASPPAGAPAVELSPPSPDHPRLRELAANGEALERQGEAISGGFWPFLEIFGSAGIQHPQSFAPQDGLGKAFTIGAQLTWPFFDGDLRRRQRAEIDAKRSEVEHLREAAAEDLTRQQVQARGRVDAARAAIAAAERRAAAAEAYQRAAAGAVAAGTGTPLDARRAEEALDEARVALLKARFDAALARAAWLQASGLTTSSTGNDR
jgi:outer membrane protein TolC